MSEVILGVDGGGSKTDLVLATPEGRIAARARAGTSNYNQVGFKGVRHLLEEGLAGLLAQAGLERSAVRCAALGLGGVGEIAREMADLMPAVAAAMGPIPHRLVNDCEVAWAGALALEPGINLVAGTGSLAFGRNAAGESIRVGGWAWAVGDEGSAHWLGRRLLQVFTQQSDLRRERTALYACLRERLGLDEDVEARFLATQLPRKDVAALSTVLNDAWTLGDETPVELWREAAAELARHVKGVRAHIALPVPTTVSGTGGVFASPVVRDAFSEEVRRYGGLYAPPRAEPVVGAVLMAASAFLPGSVPRLTAALTRGGPLPPDAGGAPALRDDRSPSASGQMNRGARAVTTDP